MRKARVIPEGKTYYHIMNRIAGDKQFYPFGDDEKEMFIKLIYNYQKLYKIDILSYCVMSNHYHLVLCCSGKMTAQETREQWQQFYGSKSSIEPNWDVKGVIEHWQKRMTSLSDFLKVLQQSFTAWYNRTHNRRGHLWADRFKSVILEGQNSIVRCIKYVELNPMRANILDENNNYRFSSFGQYRLNNKHPFEENLIKHLDGGQEALHNLKIDVEELINSHTNSAYSDRSNLWTKSLIVGSQNYISKVIKKYAQLSPDIKEADDLSYL